MTKLKDGDGAKKAAEEELKECHKECLQAALPLFKESIDPTLASIDFPQIPMIILSEPIFRQLMKEMYSLHSSITIIPHVDSLILLF